MRYFFWLLFFFPLAANDKIQVTIWPFENMFYLEYDGHLYTIECPQHSINCPCRRHYMIPPILYSCCPCLLPKPSKEELEPYREPQPDKAITEVTDKTPAYQEYPFF
jgi:hypothetical protein